MSTTKKPDDDLMQQVQEAALETVRLQARRSMSPEEQRLLANNLINILLGRGLPKEEQQTAPSYPGQLGGVVRDIMRDHPDFDEEQVRKNLYDLY